MDVIAAAKALGFSDAAVMDTKDLVFKPGLLRGKPLRLL